MAAAESSVVCAEALTYMLCLSSKIELIRTEAGYISLFSWREVFVWLPAGLGKSICFQFQTIPFLFYRRHTRLGFISKKSKTTTESCTRCSCDVIRCE